MSDGVPRPLVHGGHHIAIQTRDWQDSVTLYRDVLGMTEAASSDNGSGQQVMLLDIGDGTHLELFERAPSTPPGPDGEFGDLLSHFALATTDVRAATEHLRAAGYAIVAEPRDVELGALELCISFFRGPSGELVELVEER